MPADRHETVRRDIISVLNDRLLSAREISGIVSVSEKDVYDHLYHIQKSLNKRDHLLTVTPPECNKCGFVFRKRERLKKPGRCPVCRSESIKEPLFSIQ